MVTSSDYVTNEVLNLHMARMESLMREHFARTESENAKFREQMREDFRNFRDQVKSDMDIFKKEIKSDINAFKSEINTRFDSMQAQISVMQNDITGLKHDVNNLIHWDYWILAIIVAAFAMPHIIESIKSLFGAVRDGIAGILSLFRSKNAGQ